MVLASHKRPATAEEVDRLILTVAVFAKAWHTKRDVALAGTDISPPVRALLAALETSGPRAVPKLALALGVTRQAVQPLVDTLVAAGRAELLPNAANRRSPLVRLTDEGQRLFAAIRGAEMAPIGRIAKRFQAVEIANARRTITGLMLAVAALGAPEPDADAEPKGRNDS